MVISEDLLSQYSMAKRQTFHSSVVGITFRDQDHIKGVQDGDFALLSPELDNKYDSTAVAVLHNNTGNIIGYIKRELNTDIWNNIVKNGDLYVCKITKTGGTEDKPNIGFNLTIIRFYYERESIDTAV
jgi:hypothetical protein